MVVHVTVAQQFKRSQKQKPESSVLQFTVVDH